MGQKKMQSATLDQVNQEAHMGQNKMQSPAKDQVLPYPNLLSNSPAKIQAGSIYSSPQSARSKISCSPHNYSDLRISVGHRSVPLPSDFIMPFSPNSKNAQDKINVLELAPNDYTQLLLSDSSYETYSEEETCTGSPRYVYGRIMYSYGIYVCRVVTLLIA